jgi:hypothetical protein
MTNLGVVRKLVGRPSCWCVWPPFPPVPSLNDGPIPSPQEATVLYTTYGTLDKCKSCTHCISFSQV